MSKRIASMSRRPLAAALFVALVAPGMAFAQTAKEKQLEARVAVLEQQIQALLASQQQQQTVIADTQAQITEVKTAQAAPADGKATARLRQGIAERWQNLRPRRSAFGSRVAATSRSAR